MIVGISTTKIGELIEFGYSTPLRGLMDISSVSDSITGETGTRFFDKYFSVSIDGIHFTEFNSLSLANVQAVISSPIPIKNDFLIKFRYVRSGSDPTGSLILNSTTILGTYSLSYFQILDFNDTSYSDISFTDEYWNLVWLNQLQKVYEFGIVPKYILRGDDDPDDIDYITFWKSIAYFFALNTALVDYKITKIADSPALMVDFIRQRSGFVCDDETIENDNLITELFYDWIRRRGTQKIVLQDGDIYTPNLNPLNGELLRLICFDLYRDEFLFEYLSGDLVGWTINSNSPCFYGLTNHLQLNKTPDNIQDFTSLSNFILIDGIKEMLFLDGSKSVLKLNGGISGIITKEIKVDPSIDYEVTFMIKQNTLVNNVTFSAIFLDDNDLPIDGIQPTTLVIQNDFLKQSQVCLDNIDYVFVRGIIFNAFHPTILAADSVLNIGQGSDIKMPIGTKRIQIKIINDQSTSDVFYIWDFKMKPLSTNYNNNFVNSIDAVNIWLKKNDTNYTNAQLESNIQNYLLPYGSMLKVNYF